MIIKMIKAVQLGRYHKEEKMANDESKLNRFIWKPEDIKIIKKKEKKKSNPREVLMIIQSYLSEGGPGSGNFGHAGRPGEVGGSAPEGEGGSGVEPPTNQYSEIKKTWTSLNQNIKSIVDKTNKETKSWLSRSAMHRDQGITWSAFVRPSPPDKDGEFKLLVSVNEGFFSDSSNGVFKILPNGNIKTIKPVDIRGRWNVVNVGGKEGDEKTSAEFLEGIKNIKSGIPGIG